MNLQKTVSTILKKEVTEDEAKKFASEQFGILSSYLNKQDHLRREKQRIKEDIKNLKNWLKDDKNAIFKDSIKEQIKTQKQLLKKLK